MTVMTEKFVSGERRAKDLYVSSGKGDEDDASTTGSRAGVLKLELSTSHSFLMPTKTKFDVTRKHVQFDPILNCIWPSLICRFTISHYLLKFQKYQRTYCMTMKDFKTL